MNDRVTADRRLAGWIGDRKRDAAYLWRSFALLVRDEPRLAWAVLALGVIRASLPVIQLWLTRAVVNDLVRGDANRAIIAGAGIVATVIGVSVLRPLQDVLATRMQDRGTAVVDRALIAAGRDDADLVVVERPGFQDTAFTAGDAATWLGVLFTFASEMYGSILSLAGVLVALGTLQPVIPVIILVAIASQQLIASHADITEYTAMKDNAAVAREMEYALVLATRPENAAEIRVFGLTDPFADRYRRLGAASIAALRAARARGLAWIAGSHLMSAAAVAGLFWLIARQAQAGAMSAGDVALAITGIIQTQALAVIVAGTFRQTYSTLLRLRLLFPLIDEAGPRIALPLAGQAHVPPSTIEDGFSLSGVSFIYPESDRPVLDHLSLDLPAGTVTALVGENGAGKSTLVKLLDRMYDPADGEITLDGQPLATYDLAALRGRMTAVFQDHATFSLALADNIALADPAFTWTAPEPSRERARDVGRGAGVDWIADTLPDGYDTMLTRRFEGGVELSGGQWQLVAFARGLVREDATLAMLDEPSSALDPERERQQIARIRAFAKAHRWSVLLISHRLSTVRWADRIAVLDRGHLAECGTHAELLASGGVYARLFTMQASRYRDDAVESEP